MGNLLATSLWVVLRSALQASKIVAGDFGRKPLLRFSALAPFMVVVNPTFKDHIPPHR
jgi:hypothetical protein